MGTHPIFESDFDCLTDVLIRMEVIDLEQPVNSARWGLGEKVDDDEENNNEVLSCGSSPKKSPTKEQKKTVSDAIGNDEIQEWMVHIVDTFSRESMVRFERGEISDKNPISVKGTRDLEDGFVIGLTIRAHCPNLIAPHDITRSSNRHQKLSNWVFLNERVFNKLGFKIDDQLITDVVKHDAATIGKDFPDSGANQFKTIKTQSQPIKSLSLARTGRSVNPAGKRKSSDTP